MRLNNIMVKNVIIFLMGFVVIISLVGTSFSQTAKSDAAKKAEIKKLKDEIDRLKRIS